MTKRKSKRINKGGTSEKVSPFSFSTYSGSVTVDNSSLTDANSWYMVDGNKILTQPDTICVPANLAAKFNNWDDPTIEPRSKLDKAIDEQIKKIKRV